VRATLLIPFLKKYLLLYVESEWALRGVGDVNGNGSDDIIWQHNNGQVLYWDILYGETILPVLTVKKNSEHFINGTLLIRKFLKK